MLKANARAASVDLSHLRITMDNVFVTLREGVEVGEGTKDLLLRQVGTGLFLVVKRAMCLSRRNAIPNDPNVGSYADPMLLEFRSVVVVRGEQDNGTS